MVVDIFGIPQEKSVLIFLAPLPLLLVLVKIPHMILSRKICRRRSLIIVSMFLSGVVMFFGTGSIPGQDVDYLWILILSFAISISSSCLTLIPAFPELVANAEDLYEGNNYDPEEMFLRMGGA